MKSITKQEILHLASELQFTLNEEECERLVDDFEVYFKQVALFDAIDTSDVQAMAYPFEKPTSLLREDHGNHLLDKEAFLKLVPKRDDDFVIVPKVVK